MTDELKPLPCPWCGGKSKLIESHRFGPEDTTPHYWKVSCNVIGCNGAAVNIWYPSPEAAIAAWNRRVRPDIASIDSVSLMAESVRRGLAEVEPIGIPDWLKKRIEHNLKYTESSQKNCICSEIGERLIGYISALEWVLSLRREGAE